MLKDYLGDGVYAEASAFENGGIVLTTENGIETTNMIYLDPNVLAAFDRFRLRMCPKNRLKKEQESSDA